MFGSSSLEIIFHSNKVLVSVRQISFWVKNGVLLIQDLRLNKTRRD